MAHINRKKYADSRVEQLQDNIIISVLSLNLVRLAHNFYRLRLANAVYITIIIEPGSMETTPSLFHHSS
ncbi:hypothetical protein PNOK_0946100 [Pyrrhoderma noxium]|uniref:Uncharacterized protein n=1 Tax=Pyrrhoderma noxium TaxID=2282107 RepID=A0A286U5P8_9AGAM|nr:hypothetical protein PNOK_0946100 [Pyrrhoderma noxium]